MDEGSNILVGSDLVLIIWDSLVFWIIEFDPLSPFALISFNSVWKLLEELKVVAIESVLGKSSNIEPCLVLNPVQSLVFVINTSTCFKEHAYIT
jgi:hypothetical protein